MKVAIIGAGMSGLICARELSSQHDVHLFDKARGPAGRMSTRRVEDLHFDHGAQYFTARDPRFQRQVEAWVAAGVIAPWKGAIGVLQSGEVSTPETNPVRYVGVPAMNAPAKRLAAGLNVQLSRRVQTVARSGAGWSLTDESGETLGPFDALVCTVPPAQAADLLCDVAPTYAAQVEQVTLNPCWATLVQFEQRLPLPLDGAFVHDSPLSWIARNSSKPQRDASRDCWVLHASQSWSTQCLEQSPEEIAPQMLAALAAATGLSLPRVAYQTAHRWRYSIPPEPLSVGCLADREVRLAIGGDWCQQAKVEGAYLSGLALAEAVTQWET
ncbi:NAD(P)/FAD-dependent oxidoreductase [Blastopirellula marina]|uniref:Amine oxidase, flavin-containing n=1 Tax=Blastopirellula marina DSM 3645 TaxID=314230 RepID=A3ZMB9_9BACT|nr:FAD-dependent oxidoreductase [Blastopirellula marina]EAQ82088.1 amine oxidase, flavin-containing [Blastopirellula marina DSM 3645]